MSKRGYNTPAICWLKMTDYTHGWLQHEFGCEARVGGKPIICIQHLPGAREILRMEASEETIGHRVVGNAMSSTLYNCIEAGMVLDPQVVEELYGITSEQLKLYVPVECPKMCVTETGVLRPWTLDVYFGKIQTTALQRLLRREFWKAVRDYDMQYAEKRGSRNYPAVEMVEDFCADTDTPDMYAEAIRREWQRLVKKFLI